MEEFHHHGSCLINQDTGAYPALQCSLRHLYPGPTQSVDLPLVSNPRTMRLLCEALEDLHFKLSPRVDLTMSEWGKVAERISCRLVRSPLQSGIL